MLSARNLILAFGLSAGLVVSAFAQTIWNFGDATAPGNCAQSGSGYGNSYGCSEQPAGTVTNLQVKAYANTGSGAKFAAANVGYYGTGSGFGVRNTTETLNATSPNHAMDNYGQQDVLVLNFTAGPVALNQIKLGWWSNDSDLSVLRWTGSGTPDSGASSITNQTIGSLLSSGWAFVAALSNVGSTNPVSFNTGSAAVTSSYWLISAFNSSWGAGSITDTAKDYVKVLSVGANVPTHRSDVPEPASIALVGAALLGIMASARRVTVRR